MSSKNFEYHCNFCNTWFNNQTTPKAQHLEECGDVMARRVYQEIDARVHSINASNETQHGVSINAGRDTTLTTEQIYDFGDDVDMDFGVPPSLSPPSHDDGTQIAQAASLVQANVVASGSSIDEDDDDEFAASLEEEAVVPLSEEGSLSDTDGYDDTPGLANTTASSVSTPFSTATNTNLNTTFDFSSRMKLTIEKNVTLSTDLYQLGLEYKVPRRFMEKMTDRFNEYIQGYLPALPSNYKAKESLLKQYPLQPEDYDMCPDGCMLFIKPRCDPDEQCLHCKKDRFKDKIRLEPQQKMKYLSLAKQLALMLNDQEVRKHFTSGAPSSEEVKADIFDGEAFKLLQRYQRTDNNTIHLGMYTDGFNPFKNGGRSMTIVHFIIFNLPPSIRYENKYMLQTCVVPGLQQPKDLFSFLSPVIDELTTLGTQGMSVKTNDHKEIEFKAVLLFAGGDIPAVAKMCGHRGHMAHYGCRFCEVFGERKENRMVFMPPPQGASMSPLRANQSFCPKAHPSEQPHVSEQPETEESDLDGSDTEMSVTEGGSVEAEATTTIAEKDIRGSILAMLPSFHSPFFYPIDLMHLLGPGVGRQFYKLLNGKFGKANNPFYLPPATLSKIGISMEKSKSLVPSGFAGSCGNISKKAGFFKAVEWIYFMRYIVPTLVLEHIHDIEAKNAVTSLVTLYNLACRRKVTGEDINDIKKHSLIWLRSLLKFHDEEKISVKVFTISQHYLLHLSKVIQFMGPLPVYAAFAMERTIGEIKRNITSKKDPVTNSQNVIVALAAIRYAKRNEPAAEPRRMPDVITLLDPGMGQLWGPYDEKTVGQLGIENALVFYWANRLGTYRNVTVARTEAIRVASRCWVDNNIWGSTFGRENAHRSQNNSFVRLSVKLNTDRSRSRRKNMQNVTYFGDVLCFFRHERGDDQALLAVVNTVRIQTSGIWPYKTVSTQTKPMVVDVKSIVSPAGRAESDNGRQYIFYPHNPASDKSQLIFDPDLLYN